jgi:hypothetical protein
MTKGAGTMDRRALGNGWLQPSRPAIAVVVFALAIALVEGCDTPSPHTISRNYGLRPDAPVDPPGIPPCAPAADDCTNGGRLFKLYCGSCHNARPLGERPFSNYQVAIAHMRDQAYLTGKEYRQIIMFLRRWDNVGPPTPAVEPSPKRLIFSQPAGEPPGAKGNGEAEPAPPPPPGAGPWPRPGAAAAAPPPQPGAPAGPAAPQPPAALPAPLN